VPAKQAQYQAYLYHDLLQGLGIPLPCSPPTLNVPQRDLDWASQQRENLGLKDTGYVLISDDLSLGGGYPAEQWQTVLADFQAKQPGLPLVCLQERSNVALVQALAKTLPGLKICTATNVGQTAAMVAGADLVLCTPSSVMQMAIALNVFTLALFDTQAAVNRQLPPLAKGEETRFVGIASDTGTLVDIPADRILQKVWGG
ncbi:MAG: glycosyltransferase family 9 protein, partial [Cyanobacteria bacterium P01_D01_bin.128]